MKEVITQTSMVVGEFSGVVKDVITKKDTILKGLIIYLSEKKGHELGMAIGVFARVLA